MYDKGFWIEDCVGNNAFSYEERKILGSENPRIYVANLIEGNINDLGPGDMLVLEELNDGVLKSCKGLRNFVKIADKNIYIFDNHNHALFFWYQEYLKGRFKAGIKLIHIDQHSDMNLPKNNIEIQDSLKSVFDYTNFVCNVGNFILPAQKLGIIGQIVQIKNEYTLEKEYNLSKDVAMQHLNNKADDYILDIDIDFFAPEMGIEDIESSIIKIKHLISKAKLVTIATSPFFIEQELAIKLTKELLK